MRRSVLAFSGLIVFLFGFLTPALAQERELVGTFRDWNTFRETQDGNTVCYAVSIPQETELSRRGRERGDIYFFVTTWAELNVANQVNVVIGYPVDEDSTPTVRIGNETFEMFGQGERVWLREDSQANGLLGAMRRGSRMTVSARSSRGTESTDQYSLLGATAALESAVEACQ